jgi:hypothetical protein
MTSYPCPNPLCPHVFQAAEVQAAAALKCPVCGQVFQFRAGPAPGKPAGKPNPAPGKPVKPVAKHAAARLQSIPVAKPVVPTAKSQSNDGSAPPAHFESSTDSMFAVDGDNPLVIAPRRGGSSWKGYFFSAAGILLGTGLVIVTVVAGAFFLNSKENSTLSDKNRALIFKARNLNNAEEKAFKLVLPEKTWAVDNGIRQGLGAITAWKGVEKDGWFAVAARDYGQARPREAEMLRTGIERLEQYFEGGVELADKPEPANWGQADAQRLFFKGQVHAVTWRGYMVMLAHNGFGYWLYAAAPSEEEAQELLDKDLKPGAQGFFVDSERKGWREQPPKMKSFTSENGALTVTLVDGVFEKHQAKDQDERGQLHLFGRYQKEKDNRKNADVLVVTMEKQGDLKEALQSAKKYLEDGMRAESKDYKVELNGEGGEQSELGSAGSVGNRPGRIAEGKLLRGDTPIRFWIVAVVNEADKVYVIRCDCNWENRQIWREDFLQLLRNVTFRN